MVRVYFNARDEEFPWCVDEGEGTAEWQFKSVSINCKMHSKENPSAPKGRPFGWLEADKARIFGNREKNVAVIMDV